MRADVSFGRYACAALLCLGTIWAVAIPLAPGMVHAGRSGAAGFGGAFVYELGARVCHQRPERSFVSAGLQWPVCGRCAGLYLSFGLAAVFAWAARPLAFPWPRVSLAGWRVALGAALLPVGASWALERLHAAAFSPASRAWLAVPAGAVIALLLHGIAGGAVHGPEVD